MSEKYDCRECAFTSNNPADYVKCVGCGEVYCRNCIDYHRCPQKKKESGPDPIALLKQQFEERFVEILKKMGEQYLPQKEVELLKQQIAELQKKIEELE